MREGISSQRFTWIILIGVMAMILSGVMGGLVGGVAVYLSLRDEASLSQAMIPTQETIGTTKFAFEVTTAITDAVARVEPAVVTVINYLPPQRTLFGGLVERSGSGSGAIISTDGHIVTNNHVVEGAERLEVILADGTVLPAQLVGDDIYADLAVIQAEGEMPAVVEWGNSDALTAGETVIAIGSLASWRLRRLAVFIILTIMASSSTPTSSWCLLSP